MSTSIYLFLTSAESSEDGTHAWLGCGSTLPEVVNDIWRWLEGDPDNEGQPLEECLPRTWPYPKGIEIVLSRDGQALEVPTHLYLATRDGKTYLKASGEVPTHWQLDTDPALS